MTKDDIIRMAREAGIPTSEVVIKGNGTHLRSVDIERFAALVAAAERNRTWTQAHWTEYERSIAATEREACAKVCEQEVCACCWEDDAQSAAEHLAERIRARGQDAA